MPKFKDYRSLNGSNSRVTKKSRGIATVVETLTAATTNTGHHITNMKRPWMEPVGRIIPRKLVSVMDSMTEDEKAMYVELCKLASK